MSMFNEPVQYVIAVADHHMAIGPFASLDEAKTYMQQSGTELTVPILRLLLPVDPPSQDADLNP